MEDAAFGGGSNIKGEFAVAEVNYKLNNSDIILSSLFYYGQFDAETARGFMGGGPKAAGDTDVDSFAVRLRADWKNFHTNNKLTVTPRLSYTYISSQADAYTETGGVVNASFDKQEAKDHEVRLGLDFDYAHSAKTQFRTIVEAVYRKSDDNNLQGVVGGTAFDLEGDQVNNLWMRFGVEAIHSLGHGKSLQASAFASSEGRDASVSGALSFNMQF